MLYADIVTVYDTIASAMSRHRICEMLTGVSDSAPSNVLRTLVYLTLGRLGPAFGAPALWLAHQFALRATAASYVRPAAGAPARHSDGNRPWPEGPLL